MGNATDGGKVRVWVQGPAGLTFAELTLFGDITARLERVEAGTDVRAQVLPDVVRLLRAEFGASYVWNEARKRFESPRVHNISPPSVKAHDEVYQFRDPMSHRLRARRRATFVEEVLPRPIMLRTDFYNEVLARDGLHHGINVYVFDGDRDLGDLRIWRRRGQPEFSQREKHLLDALTPHLRRALLKATRAPSLLTAREQEVVALVAKGCKDQDIAVMLGISFATVRTHLSHAMEKSGAANRAELAATFSRP